MVRSWEQVEHELRQDWETTRIGGRHGWEEVGDDVHFGYEQGMNPTYNGVPWAEVEHELQRDWESRVPHARFEDWRAISDAVKLGYERAQAEMEEAA